ncbi:MAG TPA: hypothetical protein VNE58_03460 [Casimicrobiaceae bacterium]|nr:hypothetical protein [Casimicrobiaceae bacterium]
MTTPKPSSDVASSGAQSTEKRLDDMLKATFPASDAPQLDGKALGGEAAANAVPVHPSEHAPPPQVDVDTTSTIGAFDRGRETYSLDDAGSVSLTTEGPHVTIEMSATRLVLEAAALEQLIAALQRHRPSLNPR